MRAILTYHSIDDSGSPISVGREQFRRHCEFFSSGRVRVVPLPALLSLPDGDPAVALTFDDGFANFWTDAAPELEQRGLPATVFVVTDHVGAKNSWGGRSSPDIPELPLMDWEQVARLSERGFEVGAHTRSHPHLTSVPAAQLDHEVGGSADEVQSRIGRRPRTFAYPYGAVDARSAGVARRHFEASCTTDLRALQTSDDRALLPRLDMFYFRSAGVLEQWDTVTFSLRLWMRARGRQLRGLLARPPRLAGQEA